MYRVNVYLCMIYGYIATDRGLCYFVHCVQGSGLIHLRLCYFMYRVFLEYIHCHYFNNVCSTNCNSHTQPDGDSCRHVHCELWSVELISRCPGMLTAHRAQHKHNWRKIQQHSIVTATTCISTVTITMQCTVFARCSLGYWPFISRTELWQGSNPGGGEIFLTHPDRPWGLTSLLYSGYRIFPGGKAAGASRWPPTFT
jgi:hypothetical protein